MRLYVTRVDVQTAKILSVISPKGGEGKSTFAAYLARGKFKAIESIITTATVRGKKINWRLWA
ncbi:hypothetical protein RTE01_07990 [Raoultella terrigena]|nr:hypothetical protein RTE01_07990 [Raoultella terrigena]